MRVADLSKAKKIYFIGIGGIGISAIARILHSTGCEVAGSDATESEITVQLRGEGIRVFVPQRMENISTDTDLIVYSVAVAEDNIERVQAKKFALPEMTYPQMLGELMAGKYGIGISGTNGKTTTTAMLAKIFIDVGLDPTVVLGSKADFLGGNSRVGQGDSFIFESDEYRRAFDNYHPQMAVVTYVAADHLDFFKDLAEVKTAFADYLNRVPANGFVFINADDANSQAVAKECQAPIITFGIDNPADIRAENIRVADGRQTFDLICQNKKLGSIKLSLPAKYNIYNALAAIGPAWQSKIKFADIQKSLAGFKGTWRRFEAMGRIGETAIIADYAHTPDAIEKTIQATKEFYPGKSVVAVFQAHQYSRTKNFFTEFAKSFDEADKVVIFDIFYVRGRENPADFDVSAEKLVTAMKAGGVDAIWGDEDSFKSQIKNFDIALVLGAGDIYPKIKKIIEAEPDEELEEELALEEEYEDWYNEADEGPKITGIGFGKQKEIIEANDFYLKGSNKDKKIIDKTKGGFRKK